MTTPVNKPAATAAHAVDTEYGIRPEMVDALAAVFAELDANPVTVTRHLVAAPGRDESTFVTRRSLCGVEGLQDNTGTATSTESSVTCETCLTELAKRHAKADRRSLQSLAKAPVRRIKLHGPRRHRLELAGYAKVSGDFVVITDAGREALKPKKGAA